MSRSLALVLIRFGKGEEILPLLKEIDKVLEPEIKLDIYVVNNGPGPFSLSFQPNKKNLSYSIIGDPYNRGFAGGMNFGLQKARDNNYDYYLIANTDIIISQNKFLSQLLMPFEVDSKVGILSPKIYFAPGYEYHKDRYSPREKGRVIWYAGGIIDWANVYPHHRGVDQVDDGQFDKIEETEFATGCLMVIKNNILAKIRGFDERYFLYFEDVDLSLRVKQLGYRVIYNPLAFIHHKNAQLTHGAGSKLHFYYQERNRLVFGLKYAPLRTKLALVKNVFIPYLFSSQKRKIVRDAFDLLMKKPSYEEITA